MFLTNLLLLLVAKSLVIEISAHDECCTRKMVGSVSYTLLPASTSHRELPDQCRNDCVYTVSGTSSPKFCFARGDLPTRCLSAEPVAGECTCGAKRGNKIVGGDEASPGEWPWIVVFSFGGTDGSRAGGCGGTLVADRWVVTAAHCLERKNGQLQTADSISVVIGEHTIWSDDYVSDDDDYDDIRKNLELEKIILHEDYDSNTNQHDIALLKLKEPLDLSVYTPACMPASGVDFTGETAWVYGWGTTEMGGSIVDTLRETTQTILSNEECSTREGEFNGITQSMAGRCLLFIYLVILILPTTISITDDMICGEAPGQDSCQGDSGGPFTVEVEGNHHLVGVVSWGFGCAVEGLPGVYSSVSYHRKWLDDQMKSNGGAQFCAG